MLHRSKDPERHHSSCFAGIPIPVCKRWLSFPKFLEDMGEKPPDMTIDRINNKWGYEPWNCRWATRQQQARNRTTNITVTYQGQTKCIAEWCELLGLKRPMVYKRIKYGFTLLQALNLKPRKKISKSNKKKSKYAKTKERTKGPEGFGGRKIIRRKINAPGGSDVH